MAEDGDKRVVLISIDASENAEHAFDYYVKHVMKQKTDHVVLCHIPELFNFHWASPGVIEQLLKEESAKVQALDTRYKDKMLASGLSGMFKTGEGRPGEKICEIAKKEHAELIVMGTRGLGKARRTFLGSVSDYVLHHAHVPVLVCRM